MRSFSGGQKLDVRLPVYSRKLPGYFGKPGPDYKTGARQDSSMQMFAPMYHVRVKCSHESPIMGREDFKIIGREQNPFLLQLKESIFIYKLRPNLNNNDACVPLQLFKP